MYRLTLIFLFFILSLPAAAQRQDSIAPSGKGSEKARLKKAAQAVQESLGKETDELTLAQRYETLASALNDQKEHARAEEYLRKAQQLYERLHRKDDYARASRNLASTQEAQHKLRTAISNYKSAAGSSSNKELQQANFNDASRLTQDNNLQVRKHTFSGNARLFEQAGKKEEAANAYQQLAETQLEDKDPGAAVSSYNRALEVAPEKDIAPISQGLVNAYVADRQLGKAIDLSEHILQKAKVQQDPDLQIDQMRQLAHLHAQQDSTGKTEALLLAAYHLALAHNNTISARACLNDLVTFYAQQKQPGKSLALYKDFTGRLDSLVRSDSALMDTKIFEQTTLRIRELEKERALQLALIRKKNTFTYFLLGSIAAMLLLLALVIRSFYAIKARNKKIALQSLRREMNPHFIFNSLNSVNQFIAENNELEANRYLASYSGLMRTMMEHSSKDFVSLSVELEQLKKYIALEHRRFRDRFDYEIRVAETLDPDAFMVPNMLIQPHLENAVWHGLRYKDDKGLLLLEFRKAAKYIEVVITDNGIGLSRSRELKTKNQKAYSSRGLTNTTERIALLNDLYRISIRMHMEEQEGDGQTGTRVVLHLPLINKTG